MRKAAMICSDQLWMHGHGLDHPLRPERLRLTYELLQAYGAFDGSRSRLLPPRLATDEELAFWHTPEYIEAVKRLSAGDRNVDLWKYRFGSRDNPVFEGMYESEALKAGSSLLAAELIASKEVDVAFSFSGGLHHAMPAHAWGFCVFNDAAIAIRWLVNQGLRVAYVDIDAHHSDGVQAAFYDTDQVVTISLHESGDFLFPGTGFVEELGRGAGHGYSLNMPLLPGTGDQVYLWVFSQVVLPQIAHFKPDVLATQLGVDAHFSDPLAHLRLTSAAYETMLRAFRDSGLPWLAMGGGGYNVGTVARLWTMAYGIMSDQVFADEIPEPFASQHGLDRLGDRPGPQISRQELALTREYAQEQVAELTKLLGK